VIGESLLASRVAHKLPKTAGTGMGGWGGRAQLRTYSTVPAKVLSIEMQAGAREALRQRGTGGLRVMYYQTRGIIDVV
jgi:hypothetical protein